MTEIVQSGLYRAEQAVLAMILERLDFAMVARLEALIAVNGEEEPGDFAPALRDLLG